MEYCGLYELIKHLEYGTKIHIGVVFLSNKRNKKCALPHEHTIHSKPVCNLFKRVPKDYERCFKCRNYAIKKAIRDRVPFGSLCINGVYEYTRAVEIGGKVAAIIFIGNILTDEGRKKLEARLPQEKIPEETMEEGFDYERCDELGRIIAGYVTLLFEKYPAEKSSINPAVENVKNYVMSNLEYDLNISDIARLFYYNEVYLGRLFKKETGMCIKEFINRERIALASQMLKENFSVTEVSKKVGFNNVTYFNRIFKQYMKTTPSEYKGKP